MHLMVADSPTGMNSLNHTCERYGRSSIRKFKLRAGELTSADRRYHRTPTLSMSDSAVWFSTRRARNDEATGLQAGAQHEFMLGRGVTAYDGRSTVGEGTAGRVGLLLAALVTSLSTCRPLRRLRRTAG